MRIYCEISQRNIIFIEDLTVAELVNKSRLFYGTRNFTNVFKNRQNPPPINTKIQSSYTHTHT